jgi:hypothetical protein
MSRRGWLLLALLAIACQRGARDDAHSRVQPAKDTISVARDASREAVFRDTLRVESTAGGRIFDLRMPGQRDSLRAVIAKERALWRASGPRDYRFLLRVSCFCPGPKGWLLMEVRGGQLVQASDSAGNSIALTDWNTFSVDKMFDTLEGWVGRNGSVEVLFDPRWHFPARVRTVAFPGPDAWSLTEARAFRPI